jgi:non-ribosomal peptide synthetase component E (peptide arylation enzyme)
MERESREQIRRMSFFDRHFPYWPPNVPKTLSIPRTSIHYNLEVSATRYPDRPAIFYYGSAISYRELDRDVLALAGYLRERCGVARGDRVLLYAQNSPQFIIGYYAILRADAVVVPVNPMNKSESSRITSRIRMRAARSPGRSCTAKSSRTCARAASSIACSPATRTTCASRPT